MERFRIVRNSKYKLQKNIVQSTKSRNERNRNDRHNYIDNDEIEKEKIFRMHSLLSFAITNT